MGYAPLLVTITNMTVFRSPNVVIPIRRVKTRCLRVMRKDWGLPQIKLLRDSPIKLASGVAPTVNKQSDGADLVLVLQVAAVYFIMNRKESYKLKCQ
jgi:hypothetical protein